MGDQTRKDSVELRKDGSPPTEKMFPHHWKRVPSLYIKLKSSPAFLQSKLLASWSKIGVGVFMYADGILTCRGRKKYGEGQCWERLCLPIDYIIFHIVASNTGVPHPAMREACISIRKRTPHWHQLLIRHCRSNTFSTASNTYNKLSCRRQIARRTMSVEIFSTAAQLYEKSHLKRLASGE